MAGLAVALHMPLLAEARLEAGLEKVPLIPPIAAVRSVVGLVVAPMLPPQQLCRRERLLQVLALCNNSCPGRSVLLFLKRYVVLSFQKKRKERKPQPKCKSHEFVHEIFRLAPKIQVLRYPLPDIY